MPGREGDGEGEMERGRYREGHLSHPLIYLSRQRFGWRKGAGGVGFVGFTLTAGQRFIFFNQICFLVVVFFVTVSEHFRAGSESLPFLNTFIKCTTLKTVAEGIEEEQWDLICGISVCPEQSRSGDIAHILLYCRENVSFTFET